MPDADKLLAVIVNYKVTSLTVDCLRSIEAEIDAVPGTRIAVWENGTGPEAQRQLRQAISELSYRERVELGVSDTNLGFTGGNNAVLRPAMQGSPPDYFLLLNNDTLAQPGAFARLVQFMDGHPRVGIAGSRLENPDGSPQSSGFRFPTAWSELDNGLRLGVVTRLLARRVVALPPATADRRVDWVSGASMIIRRQVLQDIGLLDEGLFTYYDDVDLCIRAARRGWETWCVPASRVTHLGGQSSGVDQRNTKPGRRPSYWFLARRRYFLMNHGRLLTLLTDAAFLVGFALWRVRRRLQRKPDSDPPHMLWDAWRHSVFCTGFAVTPVPNPDLAGRPDPRAEPRGQPLGSGAGRAGAE